MILADPIRINPDAIELPELGVHRRGRPASDVLSLSLLRSRNLMAMLYLTAGFTGRRASELASLSAASFDLRSDQPTVTVEPGDSKHRRRDVLPLHPDLATRLRESRRSVGHAAAMLQPSCGFATLPRQRRRLCGPERGSAAA